MEVVFETFLLLDFVFRSSIVCRSIDNISGKKSQIHKFGNISSEWFCDNQDSLSETESVCH